MHLLSSHVKNVIYNSYMYNISHVIVVFFHFYTVILFLISKIQGLKVLT